MKNYLLAYDTTYGISTVAILELNSGNIVSYIENNDISSQAENIVQAIETCLNYADIKYENLSYIALLNGPASFTAIRIAIALAKAAKMAMNDIKIVTISNFEIAYYRAITQVRRAKKAVILLNAHRKQLYCQIFSSIGNGVSSKLFPKDISEPSIINLSDITNLLQLHIEQTKEIIIAGSGVKAIYDSGIDLEKYNLDTVNILPRFPNVKAIHIALYANLKIRKKLHTDKIEPLYIRYPDAVASK